MDHASTSEMSYQVVVLDLTTLSVSLNALPPKVKTSPDQPSRSAWCSLEKNVQVSQSPTPSSVYQATVDKAAMKEGSPIQMPSDASEAQSTT